MGVQVSYPGVYIEEFAPGAPIEGVGTSTAAFVGVAAKGPIDEPTLIQSWDAFVEVFGGFIDDGFRGFLAPAVNGFFVNGGTTCFVVRVATGKPASAKIASRKPGSDLLDATSVAEGPAGALKIEVIDTSILARQLKDAGQPPAVKTIKPVFQSATSASSPQPDTLVLNTVDKFAVGDRVHLQKGADVNHAIIKSIDTTAKSLTFLAPITPAALAAGGVTVFIENMATTRKVFRVEQPTNFVASQALPQGATILIKQTAPTAKEEIAIVESSGGDTITLKSGLKNDYVTSNAAQLPEISSLEFTLVIDDGGIVEKYEELAVNRRHPRFWGAVVPGTHVRLKAVEPPPVIDDLRPKVGVYSLAPGVADDRAVAWANFEGSPVKTLDLLRPVDEVAIVAVPGSVNSGVQQAVRDHCESTADRFGILDSITGAASTITQLKLQFAQVRSARGYAALYYPWITARNPVTGDTELLPPSGHIAGIYARTDSQRGVHKAPANTNIRGAIGLEHKLTDEEQGPLNLLGINVLRVFPTESQPMVWGARTTATDRNWQYVNIRRLFLFLEESIQEGIRWGLFEPNNLQLWQKLNRSITEFLLRVWRDGALFGATPKEAFYVRIDEALNPPADRALGRLTIEIGVKPSYPAEFIIVRIGIWQGGSAVSEA
jgi:Bacteriophage tail sheath protein